MIGRQATPSGRAAPWSPLSETVYLQLKDDIFDFRLLPGDRITEGEIAARLAVSRTPVREALLRLQREGYVRVHPRSGWSVRTLDSREFDELYDLRIILETASVRALCERGPSADLRALEETWTVPEAARVGDPRRAAELDERFHATLVAAAGNEEVCRCHRDVTDRIRILRRLDFTEPARVAATYREHAEILAAIGRRDAAAAAALLRAHIDTSKREARKISLERMAKQRRAPGQGDMGKA